MSIMNVGRIPVCRLSYIANMSFMQSYHSYVYFFLTKNACLLTPTVYGMFTILFDKYCFQDQHCSMVQSTCA